MCWTVPVVAVWLACSGWLTARCLAAGWPGGASPSITCCACSGRLRRGRCCPHRSAWKTLTALGWCWASWTLGCWPRARTTDRTSAWVPIRASFRAWLASASLSGRPMRSGSRWWGSSTAGTAAATRCACGASAASGSCLCPILVRASSTSLKSARPRASCCRRPTPLPFAASCGQAPPAWCRACCRLAPCGQSGPGRTALTSRSAFTRCTWGPGARPRAGAGSVTVNWPTRWCPTPATWASPTSS